MGSESVVEVESVSVVSYFSVAASYFPSSHIDSFLCNFLLVTDIGFKLFKITLDTVAVANKLIH